MSVQDLKAPERLDNPSRRGLLTTGAALGGGLLIGCLIGDPPARAQTLSSVDAFRPNAFIAVGRDGLVTVTLPKSEMGQGINTTIAMMIAEELEVGLERIRFRAGPPDKQLGVGGIRQATGGSTSVMTVFTPLRQAGSTARVMLVAAAAKAWGVDAETCRADNCQVIHVSTGRTRDYGQLVEVAATLPIPAPAPLKPASDYKVIGKSQRRLDAPVKVNGALKYAIDVLLPGMKFATLMSCPVRGGTLKSVDDQKAMAVKGVRQIVKGDDFVAVVADHTGAARKGLAALTIVWDEGPNAAISQADVVKTLEDASLQAKDATLEGFYKPSAVDKALGAGGAQPIIEAVYRTPFFAHTTMEPMNCTVHVQKDKVEVWVGTQDPTVDQAAAAKVTGLPLEAVTVNNHQMGCGLGRRIEADVTTRAVTIGKQVDGPVKVIWTREEDVRRDLFQPSTVYRMASVLGADGKPEAWTQTYAAGSVGWRAFPAPPGAKPPPQRPERNTMLYDIPNRQGYVQAEIGITPDQFDVLEARQKVLMPVGFWRGVQGDHRIFVVESFIDELAHAAGRDPIDYRLSLMTDPRAIALLKLVKEKSGWGSPMDSGRGRGVSVQFDYGSYVATVAEVTVDAKGVVKVDRVVSAVDCGQPINPRNIEAQTFGGCVFGLSACLHGEITVDKGQIQQSNFHNYRVLRMNEVPRFEVHIMPSTAPPGGLGETSSAAISPAVTNAIFAATGKRVRDLPITKTRLV